MSKLFAVMVLLATASAAQAQVAPDLAPVNCAWSQFSPAQQESLRNDFKVDSSGTSRLLIFSAPDPNDTRQAAQACNLTYNAVQLAEFGLAIGAKAAEMVGRMGVANRGVLQPDIVDRALERMHAGKRQIIGDAMSCPGENEIRNDWDQSLISGMRRAQVKTVDGRTVALVAIAMYSVMIQEGHMRRINGVSPACSS